MHQNDRVAISLVEVGNLDWPVNKTRHRQRLSCLGPECDGLRSDNRATLPPITLLRKRRNESAFRPDDAPRSTFGSPSRRNRPCEAAERGREDVVPQLRCRLGG